MKYKLHLKHRITGMALLLLCAGSARASQTVAEASIRATALEQRVDFIVPGSAAGALPEGLLAVSGADIRLLSLPDGEVKAQAQLEKPVAYAAAVVTPNGLVLVGGVVGGNVSDQVILLKPVGDKIKVTVLSSLPQPLAMAGATMMDGRLFVAGGVTALNAKEASANLYTLELGAPSAIWKKADTLPGAGRIKPAMVAVSSELYIFGGWTLTSDGGKPLSDGWGYRIKPLDGTTLIGWRPLNEMPTPLAAASVYLTGQSHIALVGGYESAFQGTASGALSGTAAAPGRIWIFHTTTDTWIPGGQLPQPAGAGVIATQNSKTILVSAGAPLMQLDLKRTVKNFKVLDYSVLILYFIVMAAVGAFFAFRQKSSNGYALGGRTIKWWAAGISMFATSTSAISFMAIPALVFRTNLVWFTPMIFTVVVLILQAFVIFPLLGRLQMTSTFEYLERRFHPSLRFLASLQCIVFHAVGRMSVVLLLPALAISAVSGMSVSTSVLIMGLITTFYTSAGGIEAVIWTDVIQGALMLVGVLLMIFVPIAGLPGGWGEFVSTNQTFHHFDMAIWSFDCSKPVYWMFAVTILIQGISVVSDQPTIQRVFSTPMKDVRRLAATNTICCVGVAALITMAGLAMFAYFHAFPLQLDPGMRNDQVMPLYVVQGVPRGLAGLIIAGLFAASLSTLAGSMNSVATLVGEDFYRRINRKATDRSQLLVMKVTSVLVGCFGTGLAYIMAHMPIDSIFQVWNEICALLGGGFVGIYVLGMFTRRCSSIGAATGAIGSIICTVLVKQYTSLHWIFFTPFAVFVCLVLGYATSWLFPSRRTKELAGLTVFDSAKT